LIKQGAVAPAILQQGPNEDWWRDTSVTEQMELIVFGRYDWNENATEVRHITLYQLWKIGKTAS